MDSFFRRDSADQDKKMHTETLNLPDIGEVHRENPCLAVRIDTLASPTLYIGRAAVGTLDSEPFWQLKKLTMGDSGSMTVEYADGDNSFDNVWADRVALAYS